ncbi:hypothetical protein RG007_003407 [Vibrio parahaemolyticus]|nr:hypothetical protein [Vibrio parahaemolyticus]ELA9726326.1 hypothetical protein [Vibrio parahaemolyticus]
MSEFKNHYGDNVAWFCAEATAALSDMAGDGMLDSSFELYSEDEQGHEGFAEIEVLKLFESASVAIEEKDERIKQLESALQDVLAITADSDGVAGYHQNGDIAKWSEFPEIEAAEMLLEGEQK